jgi:hypothetical protein
MLPITQEGNLNTELGPAKRGRGRPAGFCKEHYIRNHFISQMVIEGHTYEQVGREYGISRERVRQIYHKMCPLAEKPPAHLSEKSLQARKTEKEIKIKRMIREELFINKHGIDLYQREKPPLFQAYIAQRNNALKRRRGPVVWKLTYPEWLKVWEDSGKLSQRGRGKDQYGLSRVDMEKGFEIGNVEIISNNEAASRSIKLTLKRLGRAGLQSKGNDTLLDLG